MRSCEPEMRAGVRFTTTGSGTEVDTRSLPIGDTGALSIVRDAGDASQSMISLLAFVADGDADGDAVDAGVSSSVSGRARRNA